jgi:hypothetical protein
MAKNKLQTGGFEVSLADRLKQRNEAKNYVRLPKLGYREYRVYDIEPMEEYTTSHCPATTTRSTQVTSLLTGAGQLSRQQTLNIFSSGRNSGKSSIAINYLSYRWMLDSVLYSPPSKVKWLKPKHVTMLKLKGHRVEEL